MHGWALRSLARLASSRPAAEYLGVFFTRSSASLQAGPRGHARIYARTEDGDTKSSWATREAQYDAICTWGIRDYVKLSGSAA